MLERPTIGVFSRLLGGFFFGGVLSGIERAVVGAGGQIIAIQTMDTRPATRENSTPMQFDKPIAWDRIDGAIVVINSAPAAYVRALREAGKPVVLVAHEVPDADCVTVAANNATGIHEAVDHLVTHGHRRIAFAGHVQQLDIRQRYNAYRAALDRHGIVLDPDAFYFQASDNDDNGGAVAARRMLAAGMPMTAVVTATDFNAVGMIAELAAHGVRVPEDLAVISFDDMPVAAYHTPTLSTVGQRFDVLGSTAGELVLEQITGVRPLSRTNYVPTTLVTRESCGCSARHSVVLRPVTGDPTVRDLVAAVVTETMASGGDADADAVAPNTVHALIDAVTQSLQAAHSGDLVAGNTAATAVDKACDALDVVGIREESARVLVDGVRAVARQIASAGETGRCELLRLEDAVNELVAALNRTQRRRMFRDFSAVETLLTEQYRTSMGLVREATEDPRTLDWLRWSNARLGALGEWTGPDDDHTSVTIVGSYRNGDAPTSEDAIDGLVGRELALRSFPPEELLAEADLARREVVLIVPVRSGNRDWGVLGIVGTVEGQVTTGRETTNQWAALLGVALDHDALMRSLRSQREELRVSEQRYALAAAAANDGLWDWDIGSDSVYVSPRCAVMLGLGPDERPDDIYAHVHEADRDDVMRAMTLLLDGDASSVEHEYRAVAADGRQHWLLVRGLAVRESGRTVRLVGSLTDVTERHELEGRLRHDALYDALTGLPNRQLFHDRLDRALSRAESQPDYTFAMLFLDLDGFKNVNDSLGHIIGDQLLICVGERLASFLRDEDTASRFGGDEFAILLNGIDDVSQLPLIAERWQQRLAEPFSVEGHEVVVSASVGIAVSTTGYDRAEDVLRDADIAMYRAKALGKGTHAIFDVRMHERAVNRLTVETGIRRGLEQQEFALHYQPLVDLSTGCVTGYEALVRWDHPQRGLIVPVEFLAVAEETGLIVTLGEWIFDEACRQLRSWHRDERADGNPALAVSVNVSHRQFWHKSLLPQLDAAMTRHGVAAASLKLEITEGVIMHNPDAADRILRSLDEQGFRLHVDDFGTGYSSLEALHRFPIEALKIDRSFVARMSGARTSLELVRTMVLMGRALSIDVIAEGIETVEQLTQLRSIGCETGQGYLFSRPVPGAQAGRLMERPLCTPAPQPPRIVRTG